MKDFVPTLTLGLFVGLLAGAAFPSVAHDSRTDDPPADQTAHHAGDHGRDAVRIEILAPRRADVVGVGARAWVVDLAVTYRGHDALTRSGFAPQLTGPGAHAGIAPFPGSFSPGRDESLPGLVVLSSTTTIGAGPGTNLANLFNLTGLTDSGDRSATVFDSWIVGAPGFGVDTASTIRAAVVDDLDGNGVYDDAPASVPDADGDGDVDGRDLRALGVVGTAKVDFRVGPL